MRPFEWESVKLSDYFNHGLIMIIYIYIYIYKWNDIIFLKQPMYIYIYIYVGCLKKSISFHIYIYIYSYIIFIFLKQPIYISVVSEKSICVGVSSLQMDSPSCDTYRLNSLLRNLRWAVTKNGRNVHDCVKLLSFKNVLFSFNIFYFTCFWGTSGGVTVSKLD